MKSLELIPHISASDFSSDVTWELEEGYDIPTHYQDEILLIEWGTDRMVKTQTWLLETYGEAARSYKLWAMSAT